MSDQISTENPSWSNLPTLLLISTFKFLNNSDRFNASLVCRHWLEAFESSALWEKVEFLIDGDLVEDSRRALQFITKHAPSVKHLKFHFKRCSSQRLKEAMVNMQLLFEHLSLSGELHSFEVENFSFHQYRENVRSMMDAFKSFLSSQKNLLKARFQNTLFSEREGLDILSLLVTHNKWIRFLGLWHYFEQGVDIYRNTEWQRMVNGLLNLEILELNYCSLSEETLEALSRREKLKILSVLCDNSEGLRHTLLGDAWKTFKQNSPRVSIQYEIVETVTMQQFLILLPEATCIDKLTYRCGFSLSSDRSLRRHGVSILQYLAHAFQNTLRELRLDFGFVNIPRLEDSILNLVERCVGLEIFFLAGVLSPSLARRICEMVLTETRRISDIYLMFYFSNFESVEEMSRMQEYQQLLKARDIKFHFNLLTFQAIQ